MNTAPIVIERVYNAPIAIVWKALTDKEEMKNWYFDVPDFKPEVGNNFSFIGKNKEGQNMLHLSTVREVIPNQKLSYSWRYDGYPGDSLLTFELFEEEGKTRLKLTHEGLHTFPAMEMFDKKNFTEGWTYILGTSLREFTEQSSDVQLLGASLPQIGNRTMHISRMLNAPRELVYKVWTDPEHIKHWWGPQGFTNTIEEMDVRAGGMWKLVMHGPDGTDYRNVSEFKEVIPMERLVYEHQTGPFFIATVTFKEQGSKTLFTMEMEFPTEDILQQTIQTFKADIGMVQNVDRLEQYLANI